jgi:hypothetical protein
VAKLQTKDSLNRGEEPIYLNLSIKFISLLTILFSHNKSMNNIFNHVFTDKRTSSNYRYSGVDEKINNK